MPDGKTCPTCGGLATNLGEKWVCWHPREVVVHNENKAQSFDVLVERISKVLEYKKTVLDHLLEEEAPMDDVVSFIESLNKQLYQIIEQ